MLQNVFLSVTLKRNFIASEYHILDDLIEKVQSHKYLGVCICNNMRRNKTVDLVVGKANRSLGLLRRNFSTCPRKIREKLYFAFVRPHLEHACEVWSLHTAESKHRIEMAQRNEARFVMGDVWTRKHMNRFRIISRYESMKGRLETIITH